ncbi:hypothetical protein HAX54_051871 [Datura stramonium]|uniref:Uncharacterized protein n=1 Tax=Datura stramonium TaxID=4076 RepID=A0ABS8WQN0_DATST|nr:hypothetical protein [Datura stramonium]
MTRLCPSGLPSNHVLEEAMRLVDGGALTVFIMPSLPPYLSPRASAALVTKLCVALVSIRMHQSWLSAPIGTQSGKMVSSAKIAPFEFEGASLILVQVAFAKSTLNSVWFAIFGLASIHCPRLTLARDGLALSLALLDSSDNPLMAKATR